MNCPINAFFGRKSIYPPFNVFKQGLCHQFLEFDVRDFMDGGTCSLFKGSLVPLDDWYVLYLLQMYSLIIVLGTINLLSSTSLQVVLQLYRNSTETKKITHGVFLIKLSSNGHLLQITIIDNY